MITPAARDAVGALLELIEAEADRDTDLGITISHSSHPDRVPWAIAESQYGTELGMGNSLWAAARQALPALRAEIRRTKAGGG